MNCLRKFDKCNQNTSSLNYASADSDSIYRGVHPVKESKVKREMSKTMTLDLLGSTQRSIPAPSLPSESSVAVAHVTRQLYPMRAYHTSQPGNNASELKRPYLSLCLYIVQNSWNLYINIWWLRDMLSRLVHILGMDILTKWFICFTFYHACTVKFLTFVSGHIMYQTTHAVWWLCYSCKRIRVMHPEMATISHTKSVYWQYRT